MCEINEIATTDTVAIVAIVAIIIIERRVVLMNSDDKTTRRKKTAEMKTFRFESSTFVDRNCDVAILRRVRCVHV